MPRGREHDPGARRGLERLVGIHPVREALRARRRRLHRLLVHKGTARRLGEVLERARALDVPVEELSREDFEAVAPPGVRAQGVLLEAGPLPLASLAELAAFGEPGSRCLVATDGVEDPQNLGAVARAAEAAGATGLLVPERRAAPPSPAAVRASAGALELLPVSIVVNLPRSLGELKERSFWVYGADADEGEDLFQAPDRLFEGDLVLVFGAEGRGLRPGVKAVLDGRLRIPLEGRVASLNVAAAAAVVLFEWRRRRGPSDRS